MSRLVIVSNRCSVPKRGEAPGGLAVALTSTLKDVGGVWFGWDGSVVESSRRRPTRNEVDGVEYATIPLLKSDYEAYYQGFSNRVLWPLFHYRIDAVQYLPRYREGYRRTNEFLARKLRPLLENDDLIWVHDYHLIPMGHALRAAGVEAPIGFFLHIPFPPFDVLRSLPNYLELLWEFCAYDLIGFQTENDLRNFFECIARSTGAMIDKAGRIKWDSRSSKADVFPISIDPLEVRQMITSGRDARTVRRMHESLGDRSLIIGVDRLDYSKGLPDRFHAYQLLLRKYPETKGRVVYMQVAQPSRGDVPEYNDLRLELQGIVGEINGEFAEFDSVPLRYVNKSYARSTIMNFLSTAGVGLVTPMRDGMNLVAKEFVAAQDPEDPGVLILSQLTGAANELDSALQVNPLDHDAVADALLTALKMPRKERIKRWASAHETICHYDVYSWAHTFLKQLKSRKVR